MFRSNETVPSTYPGLAASTAQSTQVLGTTHGSEEVNLFIGTEEEEAFLAEYQQNPADFDVAGASRSSPATATEGHSSSWQQGSEPTSLADYSRADPELIRLIQQEGATLTRSETGAITGVLYPDSDVHWYGASAALELSALNNEIPTSSTEEARFRR